MDFDPIIWVQTTSTIIDAGTDLTLSGADDYRCSSSNQNNGSEIAHGLL
jgi:hypothetical protein